MINVKVKMEKSIETLKRKYVFGMYKDVMKKCVKNCCTFSKRLWTFEHKRIAIHQHAKEPLIKAAEKIFDVIRLG